MGGVVTRASAYRYVERGVAIRKDYDTQLGRWSTADRLILTFPSYTQLLVTFSKLSAEPILKSASEILTFPRPKSYLPLIIHILPSRALIVSRHIHTYYLYDILF